MKSYYEPIRNAEPAEKPMIYRYGSDRYEHSVPRQPDKLLVVRGSTWTEHKDAGVPESDLYKVTYWLERVGQNGVEIQDYTPQQQRTYYY
jgi:hypothetical protein